MTHTYHQHFSMARKYAFETFKKHFREKPVISVVKIPEYLFVTLLTAQIYHALDVPTPEELEQDIKAARERKGRLEEVLLKLGKLEGNLPSEY